MLFLGAAITRMQPHFFLAKISMTCYNITAMKTRKHYFISLKNPLTWLMVLCMVGSAVTRLVFGLKGTEMWSQIVLPICAALLYALTCILGRKERFYKTALAVWMIPTYVIS